MNIPTPGSNYNFRSIEPKLTTFKPKSAVQQQTEPQTLLVSGGSKPSTTAMTALTRSDSHTGPTEIKPSDESTETDTDESISEDAAECPDDPGDLANDRELANERAEDQEDQENQADEQRRHKGRCLDTLEMRYRSRFMVLNQLYDQLTATRDFLTQRLDGRFNKALSSRYS